MPTSKDGKEDNRPRKFNIKKHQKVLRLHDEAVDSKFSIENLRDRLQYEAADQERCRQKVREIHEEEVKHQTEIDSLKLAIDYWKKKMKKAVGGLARTCDQGDANYIGLKHLQEFAEQRIDKYED